MPDYVVTVPKDRWDEWLCEGDLAGEEVSGEEYCFYLGGEPPTDYIAGDRIYIVAHGKLRGYAPLVYVEEYRKSFAFVRGGRAVAVTINEPIQGFRGWRKRWWERKDEIPFPEWRIA